MLDLFDSKELPVNWTRIPLSLLTKKKTQSFNINKEQHRLVELYSVPSFENGRPDVLHTTEIGSNKQYVGVGDVIISKINPRLSRVWRVFDHSDYDKIASTEWIVFPFSDHFSSVFVQHLLQHNKIKEYLCQNSSGIGGSLTRIRPAIFDNITIGLPPLNEQNRIVAKIEELFSELDAGVENLTKAKEQLGVYRQSLLKHAFEGKLTEEWRKENADKLESGEALLKRVKKERAENFKKQLEQWEKDVTQWEADGKPGKKPSKPKKPKKLAPISDEELKELPELPEGWVWVRLGNLIDPPAYGTSKKSDYNIDGTGVLRIPNIVNGKIDSRDLKYTAFSPGEEEQYRLKTGDVLTIRSNGSVSLVGQCALIMDHDTQYVYAGYLIRLRPIGLLLSRFLLYCLSSLRLRNQIESKAKSTSGVNNINSQELSSLIVPQCSPIEQNEVSKLLVDSLSAADEQTFVIETKLEHVGILKQSILNKAFSGELIPQEPSDEPASKLLERIKQERKNAPKPKRTWKLKTETKRITMADLKEVLAAAKDWVSAQDAFRLCGVGDGAPTDEVEKLYEKLKQELDQKTIEVERRGDEDWLRLAGEG